MFVFPEITTRKKAARRRTTGDAFFFIYAIRSRKCRRRDGRFSAMAHSSYATENNNEERRGHRDKRRAVLEKGSDRKGRTNIPFLIRSKDDDFRFGETLTSGTAAERRQFLSTRDSFQRRRTEWKKKKGRMQWVPFPTRHPRGKKKDGSLHVSSFRIKKRINLR